MRKNKNKYEHLSSEELISVYEMRRQEKSIRYISKRINRSASTVHRVIHQKPVNHFKWKTRLSSVQKAEYFLSVRRRNIAKRKRTRKIISIPGLLEYVTECLIKKQFSPEQIASQVSVRFPGETITAKSIYNFIKTDRRDLTQYLFEGGKRRRQRVSHRRGKFRQIGCPEKPSIHERGEVVNNRSEFGHWECDTVISKRSSKTKSAVLSLRERKSRKHIYLLIPNLESVTVRDYLASFFANQPFLTCKSITFDRGTEFTPSEMMKVAEILKIKIYYCDAYRPEQKGSVENGHRGFRKNFPKGTDFSNVSQVQIEQIQDILNAKPMKVLNWVSSNDAFEEHQSKLVA